MKCETATRCFREKPPELKTLKDIEKGDMDVNTAVDYDTDAVLIMELRDEAIKWVKSQERAIKSYDKLLGLHKGSNLGKTMPPSFKKEGIAVNDWIKHFFNLSEDDLK